MKVHIYECVSHIVLGSAGCSVGDNCLEGGAVSVQCQCSARVVCCVVLWRQGSGSTRHVVYR